MTNTPLLLLVLSLLCSLQYRRADAWHHHQYSTLSAFAAGGGGFGASSSSKTTTKKSKKKRPRKKSSLDEFQAPEQLKQRNQQKDEATPELDKWGLPVATEDDIFPPPGPDTELIPVHSDTQSTSLSEIQKALKDYLKLDFDLFDENGVERNPKNGRDPIRLKLLHQSPPVLAMDNFFTREECNQTRALVDSSSLSDTNDNGVLQINSATFSPLASSKRTSTTWFCHYSQVPTLLAKATRVLKIQLEQMEEAQIVRYKTGQEFSWHYDQVPPTQLDNGGQRIATLLVYLDTVSKGGETVFRDLLSKEQQQLAMKPHEGSALLFFPSNQNGVPDERTLHKGQVAQEEKWIAQVWIHQFDYKPVVPKGNSHEAAIDVLEETRESLGYATTS